MKAPQIQIPEPVRVPIGELHAAAYNPRAMSRAEMAKLKASLIEFGLVTTVVARKSDGLVIGGHQRLEALRELARENKWTDVAVFVVYVDVDDNHARLLNIALNKISGDWDYAKLADVFGALNEVPPELLALTGFGDREMADVLALGSMPSIDIHTPVDPDAALAKQALRFEVVFATAAESDFARATLREFGMRGPGDAGAVLVAALRVAAAARGGADATKVLCDRGDEGVGAEVERGGGDDGAHGGRARRPRRVRRGDGGTVGGDGSGGAGSA